MAARLPAGRFPGGDRYRAGADLVAGAQPGSTTLPSQRHGQTPGGAGAALRRGALDGQAALPEGRSRLALASDGKKLYAIGGETAAGVTDQVTIYDPRSNGWLPGARKPTAVSNAAAVFLNDRIYVPGGTTAQVAPPTCSKSTIPAPRRGRRAPRCPSPLAAYGLAALGDKLYLFGGWDGKRYRAETYVYDPATDAWAAAAPMPDRGLSWGPAAAKDSIYVVGGYDGKRELASVLRYDPAAKARRPGPGHSVRR